MAIKLTYLVVISMIAVLLAAPMDPNEPPPKRTRPSESSKSEGSGNQAINNPGTSRDIPISDSSSSNRVQMPEEASSSRADDLQVDVRRQPKISDISDLETVKMIVKNKISSIHGSPEERYYEIDHAYGLWLLETVMRSNPDVEIYNYLKNEYLRTPIRDNFGSRYARDLLKRLIEHSGMKRPEILRDLANLSELKSKRTLYCENLMYTAIKRRDAQLLKYLVAELEIPLAYRKAPLMNIILDSNPFNRLTMPGFWETMEYVILKMGDRIGFSFAADKLAVTHDYEPQISKALIDSPAYDLLVGRELSADKIAAVTSSIEPLADFPPEIQQLRRRLVVNTALSENCLTEILLRYRGTDALTEKEQTAYERSVSMALERDYKYNAINHNVKKNIVKVLINNMITENDGMLTKSVLAKLVSSPSDYYDFMSIIQDTLQGKVTSSPSDHTKAKNIFEETALKTRSEIWSASKPEELKSFRTKIMVEFRNMINVNDISNSRISRKEYNEIVKIDGQNKKIINTEKFMEIASAAKISDQVKYKQLIELANHLLENERAIKVGENEASFLEELLPDDLLTEWNTDYGQHKPGTSRDIPISDSSSSNRVQMPGEASSSQTGELINKIPCVDGSNCLISSEEYNEFVKIDENIKGQNKKILNTEKFMKIASAAKISDQVKYKQLIELAKHLLENERAITVGGNEASFQEELLPDDLLTEWNTDYGQHKPGTSRDIPISDSSSSNRVQMPGEASSSQTGELINKIPCVDGSNCLISSEEYNEFVKIDENIKGQNKKILNTEKFMEIASAAKISDQVKYKQLIELAKHLLENERAITVGGNEASFQEELLPDDLLTEWNTDYGQHKPGTSRDIPISDSSSSNRVQMPGEASSSQTGELINKIPCVDGSNCLISSEEYNEIVKIDGQNKKIISTEKFMEIASAAEIVDQVKYKQLTKMAKYLIKYESATLDGDHKALVAEKLFPDDLLSDHGQQTLSESNSNVNRPAHEESLGQFRPLEVSNPTYEYGSSSIHRSVIENPHPMPRTYSEIPETGFGEYSGMSSAQNDVLRDPTTPLHNEPMQLPDFYSRPVVDVPIIETPHTVEIPEINIPHESIPVPKISPPRAQSLNLRRFG